MTFAEMSPLGTAVILSLLAVLVVVLVSSFVLRVLRSRVRMVGRGDLPSRLPTRDSSYYEIHRGDLQLATPLQDAERREREERESALRPRRLTS